MGVLAVPVEPRSVLRASIWVRKVLDCILCIITIQKVPIRHLYQIGEDLYAGLAGVMAASIEPCTFLIALIRARKSIGLYSLKRNEAIGFN